jgi:hypothetical protein
LDKLDKLTPSARSEYGYEGDLASQLILKINVEAGEDPLSPAERAWASSFNQKNLECEKRYPRVSKLLAQAKLDSKVQKG